MVDVPRNDPDPDLSTQFQTIARAVERINGGGGGLDAEGLVAFAAEVVPHTDHAALTVVRGTRAADTVAATDPFPSLLDRLQETIGQGPATEQIAADDMVVVDDMATDMQWPEFSSGAVGLTTVRSMFGIRLRLSATDRAVLAFYSSQPGVFGSVDRGIGVICSTFASLVLQRDEALRRAANLTVALQASRRIGAAIGVLMARRLLTEEQAFDQLERASNHLHRKLRDVAADVLETGELPSS